MPRKKLELTKANQAIQQMIQNLKGNVHQKEETKLWNVMSKHFLNGALMIL